MNLKKKKQREGKFVILHETLAKTNLQLILIKEKIEKGSKKKPMYIYHWFNDL